MCFALKIALEANEKALTSDNRYNAKITLPKINEYYFGQLMYFLMLTVDYEGELADVDAYGQPGVEVHKRFMWEMLGEFLILIAWLWYNKDRFMF